ncbi:MAG TPA: sugar-binding protein [Anaerolineae bacterium]|nr:sugar-binding protein [Anaerolineae bacterium]
MIPLPSAAPQAPRPRGWLSAVCLVLVLVTASLAPTAAGQIDLAGQSAAAYPAIRLRATLLDLHSGADYLDRTPRLYEWAVTFSMAAEAPPPRGFDAFRAAAEPAVDGDLSDWPALPVLLLDYITAETIRRIVPMPDDNSAELRSLWTPNALYFAVHVHDDHIRYDSPFVWQDDEIELAIDGRHDLVSGGPDDHQYTVNADGRISDGGNALLPPPIGVGVREVSGGWDVEVRLPIADLQTGPLYGGRRLGFTLGLHDDDDYGDWDSYMIWEGGNTFSGAAGFGVLRLVDAYQPASWQQHTYRDWFYNQRDRTAPAGDSLAVAGMGQFPSSTASINVVALDVDGDGDVDLAVGTGGINALYKNDGAGSYTRVEAGAFDDTAANTITLVALDLDGDGAPDLAESNNGAANAVYRNNGAGVFSRLAGGDFGSAGALSILTAIDADGDGRDDLAARAVVEVETARAASR